MNPEVLEILSELKSNLQYEQLGLVAKLIVQILKMKDEVDVYKLLGVEKKPRKRKTILDDHPQVKQKVIQWIDEKFQLAAFTYSETAFKICDFQDFINSLFQSTNSNVKPISHTTARQWLMKFGYYERQLELKNNRASFDHVVFDYQVDMDPPLLDREISEHQTSDDSEEMNDDLLVDVNEFFQQDDLFYI